MTDKRARCKGSMRKPMSIREPYGKCPQCDQWIMLEGGLLADHKIP